MSYLGEAMDEDDDEIENQCEFWDEDGCYCVCGAMCACGPPRVVDTGITS